MSIGVNYNLVSPVFQHKEQKAENFHVNQSLSSVDLDKIPGVDTVNNTMSDLALEGKAKSRKFVNIVMTMGLAVAAFFTGKRISKSVMDSICNHTIYLDSFANVVRKGIQSVLKPINNINVEKGSPFIRSLKSFVISIPKRLKDYSRTGIHRDLELERYAKAVNEKVENLNANDLKRFDEKFINTIAKNGISKLIASTIGLATGIQTFIEVAVDKNKNGIPDLFEQKSYKEIMEIPQAKIDEKVIEQVRKINKEEDDEEDEKEFKAELD